jgi:HTH-type transcriptional regulator/antitoxin HipB
MDYRIALPSQLSDYLRSLRKAAGFTQAQLGARLGISQRMVAKIEAAPTKVSFERVHRMLAELDADLVIRVRSRAVDSSASAAKADRW